MSIYSHNYVYSLCSVSNCLLLNMYILLFIATYLDIEGVWSLNQLGTLADDSCEGGDWADLDSLSMSRLHANEKGFGMILDSERVYFSDVASGDSGRDIFGYWVDEFGAHLPIEQLIAGLVQPGRSIKSEHFDALQYFRAQGYFNVASDSQPEFKRACEMIMKALGPKPDTP